MAVAAEAVLETQRLGALQLRVAFCVRSYKCATATILIRLPGQCHR
jgi:hypothetical protein